MRYFNISFFTISPRVPLVRPFLIRDALFASHRGRDDGSKNVARCNNQRHISDDDDDWRPKRKECLGRRTGGRMTITNILRLGPGRTMMRNGANERSALARRCKGLMRYVKRAPLTDQISPEISSSTPIAKLEPLEEGWRNIRLLTRICLFLCSQP